MKITHFWIKCLVFLFLGLFLLFNSCTKKKSTSPTQDQEKHIWIKLGGATIKKDFSQMSKTTFEGEEVIRLSDFIDSTLALYPTIYAYRIIGSDGFYAALKGSPDNTWDQMNLGYIRTSDRQALFDSSLHLKGRYFVKDVEIIELLRKVEVKLQDSTMTFLILDMDTVVYTDTVDTNYNGELAVQLIDFVNPFTSSPENYSYKLIAADGFNVMFGWAEIETGYFLIDLDKTKFFPDLGGKSRIKYLEFIELVP